MPTIISSFETKQNDMAVKEVNTDKLKALQLTMEKLDKAFGKGTVMKLGDAPLTDIEVKIGRAHV